jgi:hypothetical protein
MFFEGSEGVVELAVVAAFVAAEEVGMAVSVAQDEEGAEGLAGRVLGGMGFALAGCFVGEAGGFEGPDAEEAPVGDGHFFDEDLLDAVFGLVFGGEGVEERAEAAGGFVGEEDGADEEGFAARVAAGFGGVGAVGGEFAVGEWHTFGDYTGWVKGFRGYVVVIIGEKSCDRPQMNTENTDKKKSFSAD